MAAQISIDDSHTVWSVPPEERGSRPLVVLMHGRGSHEEDLAGLVRFLPPEFIYASLRAPRLFEGGGGFSWFTAGAAGEPPVESVNESVAAVSEWLDRVAPNVPAAACGFSQGGAMALHLMRHTPERFFAYVNLSGFVVTGAADEDARLEQLRPPVFWGRDINDPIIPAQAIEATAQWLPAHSRLTEKTYEGIAHSISGPEIDDVNEFLRDAWRSHQSVTP